jgi:hypothetical protein
MVESRWGPHTFDRFASESNHQCCQTSTRSTGAKVRSGVDAFAQDWDQDNNWLNPPFVEVGKVVRFLRQTKASGSLLVPVWPKQSWWHVICPRWKSFGEGHPGLDGIPPVTCVADLLKPGVVSRGSRHGGPRHTGSLWCDSGKYQRRAMAATDRCVLFD